MEHLPIRFHFPKSQTPPAATAPQPKRKLLLVYPPLTVPTSPPLGAPMLKAYIERELPQWQVKVLDLNLWCYGKVFALVRSGMLRFGVPPLSNASPADLLKIEDFFRGETPEDLFQDAAAYDHYGGLLASLTQFVAEHLGQAADAWTPGAPLDPLLAEALQLIEREQADCYGFSMIFSQQLPIGALFGRWIRQRTGKKVFFGGSCFTAGAEDFLRWYPESTDAIVDGDGEEPLKQLLLQDGDPKGVAGAVFWRDGQSRGEVARNPSQYQRDIDAYGGAPDFSDFRLTDYYSPQPIVPLLLSRGCYWRRCTFCVHYMSAGLTYRLHGLERAIDILRAQVAQGVRHFSFVDEMIAPGHFANLADAIIAAGLDISYYALAKPNKAFKPDILRKMAQSGCKYLLWGLESGSQRILDLMDKGTHIDDVEQVLRQAHAAGIANHVYVMVGFPTETREEFLATLRFLDPQPGDYLFDPPGRVLARTGLADLQGRRAFWRHPQVDGQALRAGRALDARMRQRHEPAGIHRGAHRCATVFARLPPLRGDDGVLPRPRHAAVRPARHGANARAAPASFPCRRCWGRPKKPAPLHPAPSTPPPAPAPGGSRCR